MKKLLTFGSILISMFGFSQSDTLYLLKNKKLTCKIVEVNDLEIKYRPAQNMEGPLYIIDKTAVAKYTLSTGLTEYITRDELSLENEHAEILGNRQVIKFSPFSMAFSHLTFSYESVIKVGMNLDVEAGFINSEINPDADNLFRNNNNNGLHNSGFFFKPGMKFFLGEDFSIKGLKYAHPLKGRYVRLDFAVSYINFRDMSRIYYQYNNYGPMVMQTVYSDMNTFSYGGFVNYGRQFILGNILTLDYYFGVGFTGQTESYTNPDFFKDPYNTNTNYYGEQRNYTSNYHGFLRVPVLGLSATAGFRIGYIIPQKENRRQPVKQ